jgi:hypothetical protein
VCLPEGGTILLKSLVIVGLCICFFSHKLFSINGSNSINGENDSTNGVVSNVIYVHPNECSERAPTDPYTLVGIKTIFVTCLYTIIDVAIAEI